MSNADVDSTRKSIEFENVRPDEVFVSEIGAVPLTFEYNFLKKTTIEERIVKGLLNKEMLDYLSSKGLDVLDFNSGEVKSLIKEFQETAFLQLERTGEHYKTIPLIELGTPIVVERWDSVDKLQKINIVFAAVKANKTRSDKDSVYFLAHPVDKNGLNELSVSNQHRSDDSKRFSPPIWLIEPKYPFGKHQQITHIISYPLQDR